MKLSALKMMSGISRGTEVPHGMGWSIWAPRVEFKANGFAEISVLALAVDKDVWKDDSLKYWLMALESDQNELLALVQASTLFLVSQLKLFLGYEITLE